MKSVLIIGIGKFGRILAEHMLELGNDIMIVDEDEEIINEFAPMFTHALIGDCTNENVLKSLDVKSFDICFVTIGEDFQSSLEITSLLKEYGAKYVISKATIAIQEKFLLRNGADEVIFPERDVAVKLAVRCNKNNILDYFELTTDYAIYEITIPKNWANRSLADIDVRQKHNINVLAVKKDSMIIPVTSSEYVFQKDDHAIIMGKQTDVFKIVPKK